MTILIMPRSSHPRSAPCPHLDPDERDRLADDLARQCNQCTHAKEKPCP